MASFSMVLGEKMEASRILTLCVNISTTFALKASFQIFGREMRTLDRPVILLVSIKDTSCLASHYDALTEQSARGSLMRA